MTITIFYVCKQYLRPFGTVERPRGWHVRRARYLVVVAVCAVLVGARAEALADHSDRSFDGGPPGGTPAFVPPSGQITLQQALAAALLGNPSLPSSQLELRAREAEVLQAGLLPNPSLTTEVEDFGGSGSRESFNASQTTVSLSQLIELGGKRARRVRLAQAEQDLSRWDYETRRIEVLTAMAKAFFETLAAQERLALADELLRVADESVKSVSQTVNTGAVSPIEEDRARVALSQGKIERDSRLRALEQAKLALAQSWGSTEVTFSSVRGDFPTLASPPRLDQLLSRIEANPDLARWTSELEARRAAVALAKAQAVPDLTLSAGGRYYQDEQDGGVVALFSLPLPLFNRNQGAILAAERRLSRARSEKRAAEVTVTSLVSRAYEALLTAYQRALELRDTALPQARAVFDGTRSGYARGLFRYLEVLDAQRTLFDLRADYVTALADYHQARVDVARLLGEEPTETHSSGEVQ